VHDLTKKTISTFNLNSDISAPNTSEKIIFELLEEEVVEPTVVSINKEEMMVMSEFIKNLDVTFEIVSPINDIDFMVSSPKTNDVNKIDVVEPKVFEKQATFSFDLPLFEQKTKAPEPVAKVEENKILFELTDDTRDIVVNQPVQFVPVTELTDNGIIKYSLEEYMEVENSLLDSKLSIKAVEEIVPEELNITMKKVDIVETTSSLEEVSPMDMTIQETLKARADERRKKLKEFNYKFHSNISKIDELEREPAYKRLGIDLSSSQVNNTNSRISVGIDSNDDLQLRSNNSYLHDNVD